MISKKPEIIIVSFSEIRSGGFDNIDCSHKNLLLKSIFWVKSIENSWINKSLIINDFVKMFHNFSVDDETKKTLLKIDSNYTEEESINWYYIFEDIVDQKPNANKLVELIDNNLLSKSDTNFIGFQQFKKSNLYYFNTDQLYDTRATRSKKPYLPDFLIQAWCDAYCIKPGKHDFRLVIHDREIDGENARPSFYDDILCELRGSKKVPCRIVTFSHDSFDERFIALKSKDIKTINNFFTLGLSVLNFVMEALQNAIMSDEKKDIVIELNDRQINCLKDLKIPNSKFESKFKTAIKTKKIIVSAKDVDSLIDVIGEILDKN